MKILHVTAGIQETCGVSCFVMETAKAQQKAGHQVCIVTTVTCGYPSDGLDIRLLRDPMKIDFEPDIVHIHCSWNMYVHKMAVWARKKHIPYLISPHGTLTPWALKYHWWKKLPALLLYQYRDYLKSSGFHVTAQEEMNDIRRLLLKQPVFIAPLGCEIPSVDKTPGSMNLLFLSRIHPKKGLLVLLRAWNKIPSANRSGWKIIIAGPDDVGHQAEVKSEAQKLGFSVCDFSGELQFGKKNGTGGGEVPAEVYEKKISESNAEIIFTGPVYSRAKRFLFSSSRFFVLPSFSENFGGVVLESLAAGTPAVTTTGTPWQELPQNHCGWWVDPEENALVNALSSALALPEKEYDSMSEAAREFVRKNYSWKKTADVLLDGYGKILAERNSKK